MKSYQPYLKQLAIKDGVYAAGAPRFRRNFSRDGFIYGLLTDDLAALKAQFGYSAARQGKQADPVTGEESGKIHHEWPGVKLRNILTTYNACDTTSLFLLTAARLAQQTPGWLDSYKDNVDAAVGYIKRHVRDSLFYEDPSLSGADHFALKATYWKDSVLNANNEEPQYPAVFSLAHWQAVAALRAIGELSKDAELDRLVAEMQAAGMKQLWRGDHFVTATDASGAEIDPMSSDSLHALYYLPAGALAEDDLANLVKYSKQLETEWGYQAGRPTLNLDNDYHVNYVWVFEQAMIHAGAARHSLHRPQSVAARVRKIFTQGYPELIDPTSGQSAGNQLQLWSIGAAIYFSRLEPLP